MVEKYIVGCYGLAFDGGNILMVKQHAGHWAGKWILPGGKLEMGEFASAAGFVGSCSVESSGFRWARASGISGFDTSYNAMESLRALVNI